MCSVGVKTVLASSGQEPLRLGGETRWLRDSEGVTDCEKDVLLLLLLGSDEKRAGIQNV